MATAVIVLRLIAVLLFAFATFGFNPFDRANLVAAGLCLWCLAGLLPALRAVAGPPYPGGVPPHTH